MTSMTCWKNWEFQIIECIKPFGCGCGAKPRVYKESRSGTDMSEMCSEKNEAGQDPGFCAWEFDWSSSGLTACCSECGAELDGNWDGRLDWWPNDEEE